MERTLPIASFILAVLLLCGQAQSMELSPAGSRLAVKGQTETFTGSVTVSPLFVANDNLPAVGGEVTFEPGARSAWHTHPGGQTLIVTSGAGWIQEEGSEKRSIKPGDVIWTPPNVKHWHGATATTEMRHIAITGLRDGRNVEWLEKVPDEDYLK
ncbi:(R)-mandelonitrile lyase [Rhizobium multihospitium]|uniref:Cupin domain protein n=1 Tax=Rhizobium multihospitium TaxID=410764 RepID=A0A1C3TVF4_9HYPH|nr:cupin domain-containing protein [Rhizobium multihospitium]SCB07082.1 Cupin domain protein [Rhizobium multihospitium]